MLSVELVNKFNFYSIAFQQAKTEKPGLPPNRLSGLFLSISFPSEWGVLNQHLRRLTTCCFHSISFPSEWGVVETPGQLSLEFPEFPFN